MQKKNLEENMNAENFAKSYENAEKTVFEVFFPIRKFPRANDRNPYISVDDFYAFSSLVLEPYELNRSTSVADRSQYFTVEIARCKHKLYDDSCSSFTSHL